MAHVQTVLGPIEPDALGFTLPHEHTQIALWHIESRWDYWQLTRDEPVILEELAAYRAAGGRGLVDLTVDGDRIDPAALAVTVNGSRYAFADLDAHADEYWFTTDPVVLHTPVTSAPNALASCTA